MAENIHKNDHSAGLYRAMARRFYSRYVEMRESAHHEAATSPITAGSIPNVRPISTT